MADMFTRRLAINVAHTLGLRHLAGSRLQRTLRAVLDDLDLQIWQRSGPAFLASDRDALHQHLIRDVIGDKPVDYLEFGVYKGHTILNLWSAHHPHPESRLIGFDSFEGLPEDWKPGHAWGGKGTFNAGGIPHTTDPRVQFVKGWFHESIPTFMKTFYPRHRILLHCDADLYSSTMWALFFCSPFIRPGTLLAFDEFTHRDHEFRAFTQWQQTTHHPVRLIAGTDRLHQAVFEVQPL
jgi:hypothetical protein